ncbi:hypothetical protein [Lachnobacterium bovis]|uniref:hypothetical protein n=1 Tax=Lachnobacterium bovis TaxID=140626 RepID=UPI0006923A16|nr:hypothetical protein [Lachnobacterium bovis]
MKITFGNRIKKFSYKNNRFLITIILAFVLGLLLLYSKINFNNKRLLVYSKNLDEICAVVDGDDLTLRNFAFYVAYEEAEVEEKAKVYDSKHPENYWKMHTNGQFIKYAARNAAIDMGVHDYYFYKKALKDKVKLTNEEKKILKNNQLDFWEDLKDRGADKLLGIKKQDIYDTMEKMAIAQKEQYICEQLDGMEEGDYDFNQDAYKELLEKKDYKIVKGVWTRIDFGNITFKH